MKPSYLSLIALSMAWLACGPVASAIPSPPTDTPVPPPPTMTPVPPTTTSTAIPTPTTMPMPTENILGSGTYTYTDPTGDCLANEDAPVAVTCDPAGIDIREVTYAWQGAGLTILLELGGPGLDSLLLYGVIVGLDLDKNVGTGHSANHEELFGMGIEVEARVDVAPDVQELRTVMGYENNSGQDLNSDWLEWEFTDETHLRVALNPGVVASQSFGVGLVLYGVQSENEDDVIFDFAPDGAYVTVPGGEVVLPSQ